jgi:hypothetical protein
MEQMIRTIEQQHHAAVGKDRCHVQMEAGKTGKAAGEKGVGVVPAGPVTGGAPQGGLGEAEHLQSLLPFQPLIVADLGAAAEELQRQQRRNQQQGSEEGLALAPGTGLPPPTSKQPAAQTTVQSRGGKRRRQRHSL